MSDAILIGNSIRDILTNSQSITTLIGNKVFPLVAENDTNFDFVVYNREAVNPSTSTKDGYVGDMVVFRIDCLSDSYAKSVNLANEVRKVFEKRRIVTNDLIIEDCYMASINEAYDTETFIQTMRFACIVNNNPEKNNSNS